MPEAETEYRDEQEYRRDLRLGPHECESWGVGFVLEGVTGLIFTQLQ